MKFAYYPGCNAEEISKQLDISSREVLNKLDVELVDFEDFNCCGSGALEDCNSDINLTINARNFAIAEKAGLDIITICSTCYNVMQKAKKDLENENNLKFVNNILKKQAIQYKNKVKIIHFAEILNKKEILLKIKNSLKNPLKNMNIAPYYGCHILRPSKILEDKINLNYLENIIKIIGGEVTEIKSRNSCCGLHISLVKKSNMLKMTGSILNDAKKNKADLIVTLCTLCHFSLDANQSKSQKYYGKLNIPVLFLSQVIGIAMGLDENKLGINKNIIEFKNGK